MSVTVALQQIVESDLGPKIKANATALLQRAHTDNGYACTSWTELGDLFDAAPGTVRRQLGELHKARIIHYSTNGDGLVYVIFKAWTPADPRNIRRKDAKNSTENARGRAKSVENFDGPEMEGDEGARVGDQKDAKNSTETRENFDTSYTRTRARSVSQSVSQSSTTDKELTNLLTDPAPERARSYALLTDPDVYLDTQLARQFATDFSFDYLLRHVCVWRSELASGKARSPGALVNRIRKNFGGMITEGDRASPLYRRHVPQEETQNADEEQRRRKYDPLYWDTGA